MKFLSLFQIAFFIMAGCVLGYVCCARKDMHVRMPYTFSHQALTKVDTLVPVLIVGSGPAGLMAAVYTARAHMPTFILEGNEPGGALTKTTYIENWPGFGAILGNEVIEMTRKQAQHFGATFVRDSLKTVDTSAWPFKVTTESGTVLYAMTIIIATGSSPLVLGIPGEKEYWGKGVTTCAICDAPFHKDKDVVVVGGGDSAIEEALQLAPYAKTVTLIVRKNVLRAAASMQDRLQPIDNIAIAYTTEVREVHGNEHEVTEVVLENTTSKEKYTKPVSGLFLAIGHTPNSSCFKSHIDFDDHGYIKLAPYSQETSLRGIFAAGDVSDKRYKQASTALGDGVKAALEAVAFLQEHDINMPLLKSLSKKIYVPAKRKKFDVEKITTLERLEAIIQTSGKTVFVDFYAPYCPSCMMMLPAVSSVAYDIQDKGIIVKVDASESPEIAEKYHVGSLPCFIVFKKGSLEEVARYNDAMTEKELSAYVQQFIEHDEKA